MSSKKYLKNHTCVESLMINNTEKKNILNLDKIDEILIKPKEKEKIIVSKESIPNFESYIFRGIPCFLRNKLYSEFMDDYKLEVEYKYENKEISMYEHQIDVDIQRTFRNHSLFRQKYGPGQCRLFRVLISFADYMPEIGYCQGMSSIAGVLLMYFNEKDAFVMLVKIIKKNKLEGLFDKTLSKLDVILQIQDKLIQTNLPEIHTHLEKENISYTIYATSWYLTLFSRFKLELCLRIWDLFMYYDISILFYVVIAILKYFKNEILNFKNEDLIEFLSKIEKYEINTEKLFKILEQILIKVDLNVVRLELGLDLKN